MPPYFSAASKASQRAKKRCLRFSNINYTTLTACAFITLSLFIKCNVQPRYYDIFIKVAKAIFHIYLKYLINKDKRESSSLIRHSSNPPSFPAKPPGASPGARQTASVARAFPTWPPALGQSTAKTERSIYARYRGGSFSLRFLVNRFEFILIRDVTPGSTHLARLTRGSPVSLQSRADRST